MKSLTNTCAMLLALASPAMAQSDAATPGRELAEVIYGTIEGDPSVGIDMGEFISFGQNIFVSMDYDESGSVNLEEFTNWDFGFNFIAQDGGQERAYQTAQKVIFAMWDHNADGEITKGEYQKSMVWDFRRADVDDDAFLTKDEFLRGYIVNVAYRAALTGN